MKSEKKKEELTKDQIDMLKKIPEQNLDPSRSQFGLFREMISDGEVRNVNAFVERMAEALGITKKNRQPAMELIMDAVDASRESIAKSPEKGMASILRHIKNTRDRALKILDSSTE